MRGQEHRHRTHAKSPAAPPHPPRPGLVGIGPAPTHRYRCRCVSVRPATPSSALVVRRAASDGRLVHVRLRDDRAVPAVGELRALVERIAIEHPMATAIRTAALFPRPAERFLDAGFEVADRLALLRADLRGTGRQGFGGAPPAHPATRALRRRHLAAASTVDRAAFGAQWGHDAAELEEICRATPFHRARRASGVPVADGDQRHRRLTAFAIAGASSDHGYLQRLAVDPARQRQGYGRSLTLDVLAWLARRRLHDCLVNTSVDNVAALALYDSLGFAPMDEELSVLLLNLSASTDVVDGGP